jgi:pimeloyl-ACP methyl ester carboxylesterase
MPYAELGSLRLYYEVRGPEDGEPLILIHGLGAQMIAWYPGFCTELESAGFRVIRFDNRDVGLSSKFEGQEYGLQDMANDVAGLMDHLGLDTAHVVGQSMGGMVAQQFAISCSQRVRSLCSIYSAPSGAFLVNDEEVRSVRSQPPARDRAGAVRQYIDREKLSGMDGFDDEWIEAFAASVYDRNYCPEGADRQMTAALKNAEDRQAALAQLRVPTVVIHGREDRLVSFQGGVATALAIPDAELHIYAGMGHQIPPRLWPEIVGVIRRNARRASSADPASATAASHGRAS